MEAPQETKPGNEVSAAIEFAKMSKMQKLATLLLILDNENSAHILGQLEEHDLEAVTSEMTKITGISQSLQQEVLREFSPVAVEAVTTISCGVERVKGMLEKSVGLFRASDIICRVSPTRAPVAAMEPIAELDARQIFSLLRNEQLQTVALVTSYLPPDKASQLISLLRPEVRDQVVERLATLAPTSIEVVESVAEELQRKMANNRTRALNQTGGLKIAAELLNALPKNLTEPILMSLRERNSDLGDAILKKMFTFEELGKMDTKTLQKIMQEIDMRTLTISLKTASESLKSALLSVISKRAAESVREEIAFLGPLKVSEIEAAQAQIIDTVRRLESEGEINLEDMRQGSTA
jgi:flagellar motor switch protein FliG